MGFFGSFFGNDQRNDIQKANKKATNYMKTGFADANRYIDTGYGDAKSNLGTGYNKADEYGAAGYNDFNKYLTSGFNEGNRYVTDAYGNAKDALTGQYNNADRYAREGYDAGNRYSDQAYGLYDPIAQEGRNAYTLYQNALGLNGADAAKSASDMIYNNPMFVNQDNLAQRNQRAYLNSRGGAAGGNAELAAQRVLQENANNYLAKIQALGARGDTAINNQANIRNAQAGRATDYGYNRANMANAYGTNLANMATAYGTNMGNMSNQYYGSMANAANAYGTNRANLANNYYGSLAELANQYGGNKGNLAYGYGGTMAGNEINKGNALAASRSIGPQNVIGLTSALSGFFRPTGAK